MCKEFECVHKNKAFKELCNYDGKKCSRNPKECTLYGKCEECKNRLKGCEGENA